ncbi:hypothetical protein ACGFX4_28420 [Kitasatospora sp. NPDC048365]|uniref:hypothetical protein n=1 Tax=Kitasatospora sp. NPDC048365 TaxID=3364050 RepID=UPI00371F3C7C
MGSVFAAPRIDGYATDTDLRVTKNGYGTPIGGPSGWTLKTPTSVTTDAALGGANLTATIQYDSSGRAVESRKPGSTGTDAATVKTVFYTAGANGQDAACGNRPEWAGSPCVTLPGGAIAGGDATRMPTTLPVKRVTRYSRFGEAEETTETNAGKTRTATTVYDGADRIMSAQITSDEGQALPPVTTEYDPATGDIVKTTAGTKTLTRSMDALGRLISYTDADGGTTTTTEFDQYGKPTKVTDPTGSTTYTYDSADRLTDTGYTYDAFGRTTKTATGATNSYWANDKVASQEKGDTQQTWELDPAHRLTAFKAAAKQGDGTWANATSKLNHYGDDSDEVRWVIEDTTQSSSQ